MELQHHDRVVVGAVFLAVIAYVAWVAYDVAASVL
jgi:hypothetical protein